MDDYFAQLCGLLFLYILSPFGLVWWYHRLRNSNRVTFAWIPLVLMMGLVPILSYWTALGYSSVLRGPGAIVKELFCTVPVSLIVLAFHFSFGTTSRKAKQSTKTRNQVANLTVTLLIISYTLSPSIGYEAIRFFCASVNKLSVQPVSQALEIYYADNGTYPSGYYMDALVPQYIEEIPQPICRDTMPFLDAEYRFVDCMDRGYGEDHRPRISIHVSDARQVRWVYDLTTDNWLATRAANGDGICSFLE